MSLLRFPFPRQKPKSEPIPETETPESKRGRFKVTIKPVLRGTKPEWWVKIDDGGEQAEYWSTHTKADAERLAHRYIEQVKELEEHEKQEGTEWVSD